jgi:hypothetical protein
MGSEYSLRDVRSFVHLEAANNNADVLRMAKACLRVIAVVVMYKMSSSVVCLARRSGSEIGLSPRAVSDVAALPRFACVAADTQSIVKADLEITRAAKDVPITTAVAAKGKAYTMAHCAIATDFV